MGVGYSPIYIYIYIYIERERERERERVVLSKLLTIIKTSNYPLENFVIWKYYTFMEVYVNTLIQIHCTTLFCCFDMLCSFMAQELCPTDLHCSLSLTSSIPTGAHNPDSSVIFAPTLPQK